MFLVTKQDVCRYYKEDLWGELIRRKNVRNHLNRLVFGKPRRSRIAQMNYRPTRFEVIKMDNRRYKRKRRIPKSVIRYHNAEKVRLYYSNMDEYGLRAFIMLQRRRAKLSGSSYVNNTCIYDRLGYRLDHLIYMLNWAHSISEARRKISNGYFQVNNFIPLKYNFLPLVGDELKVRDSVKNLIFRELRRKRVERFNNYKLIQMNKVNFMKKAISRKGQRKRFFKMRKIISNVILKVPYYRKLWFYSYKKRMKKYAMAKRRHGQIRVPYSLAPRSFFSSRHSIIQNRYVRIRGAKGSFNNLGYNPFFSDTSFQKPEVNWQFRLSKFFFDRLLYHYNGRFYFYKNFNYYENENLKTFDNLKSQNVNKLISSNLRFNLFNFQNDLHFTFPSLNSFGPEFDISGIENFNFFSLEFLLPIFSNPSLALVFKDNFIKKNLDLHSRLLNIQRNDKYFHISSYFNNNMILMNREFKFMDYMDFYGDSQNQFFRILTDHFSDFKKDLKVSLDSYFLTNLDFELDINFSPLFKTFQQFRNFVPIMEKRLVFNILWRNLYLARLRRSNFIVEAVARLARSEKSMFAYLSKRFRFHMYLLKFGTLTKKFSQAIKMKVASPEELLKTRNGEKLKEFFPDFEWNEHNLPVSAFKISTDFLMTDLIGQDETFSATNTWLDYFLSDLSMNAVISHKKQIVDIGLSDEEESSKIKNMEDIRNFVSGTKLVYPSVNSDYVKFFFKNSRFQSKLLTSLKKTDLSDFLIEKYNQSGYEERELEWVEFIKKRIKEEEEAAEKRDIDNGNGGEIENANKKKQMVARPDGSSNTPWIEKKLLKKKEEVLSKEFNENLFAIKFVNILKKLSSKFNFYKKILFFRRKQRPLNQIFLPVLKKIRNKRRRTLLLRNFNNLLINYKLLKVLFIGYRKIRKNSLPFFYYPCKFSVKVFLNHFGCKRKMKEINKKTAIYLQKPHLPFRLPDLKKKKFGMMDKARAKSFPIDKKRNHPRRMLSFILNH